MLSSFPLQSFLTLSLVQNQSALTSAYRLYCPLFCHICPSTKWHPQLGVVQKSYQFLPEDWDRTLASCLLYNEWMCSTQGMPAVIVYPSPCYSSVLVSCSLSLTLELWQGFRLSWQEVGGWIRRIYFTSSGKCRRCQKTTSVTLYPASGRVDITLVHWAVAQMAWFFGCCRCCAALFGGILSPPLVTLKGQKLRPRHFQIRHPIHDAQGVRSTVSTKGIGAWGEYTQIL